MKNTVQPTEAPEGFITKAELVQRLNMPLRTVERWMHRNWLPYYKIGHSVRFKWSEVEAQLRQTCRIFSK